jgi:hypothetical protein
MTLVPLKWNFYVHTDDEGFGGGGGGLTGFIMCMKPRTASQKGHGILKVTQFYVPVWERHIALKSLKAVKCREQWMQQIKAAPQM